MITGPVPSLESKEELKENGITCLSEFGQAARFLLRHSGSQENLQRTARNFVAQDKTIDSTGNVITKLQLLLSELEVKTDRTFSCFENVSKVLTRIQECNAMVMPRAQSVSALPSPLSSLATPASANTLASSITTAATTAQEKMSSDTLTAVPSVETRTSFSVTTEKTENQETLQTTATTKPGETAEKVETEIPSESN